MNSGWVKLHRQILDNEFLSYDNNAFIVFTKLLLLADKKTGRYITGRYRFAEIMNLNPSTARNVLDRLCKQGLVDSTSDNKRTVISICKWKQYQQVKDSPEDSQRTTKGQPEDTKQELRIKNKEIVSKDTMVQTFGKPEINDLFSYWETTIGYPISSQTQKNRNACNNLLKKYSSTGVRQLIDGVAEANGDEYAPQISDFAELQLKTNKLISWGNKTRKNRGITVIS